MITSRILVTKGRETDQSRKKALLRVILGQAVLAPASIAMLEAAIKQMQKVRLVYPEAEHWRASKISVVHNLTADDGLS
jgi:hypothetical protein